ncbi:tRNA preQ1(34) S-adenosylmethionine ribosyltransferase-isomerase QueA [bacterium]|nr:tRNA preQ1(34) S-adenosylmethionine ribosyltransferase-isomerase QueA [bacterium]
MWISEFDYHLPPELIAQRPLPRRDQSRMMVLYRHSGEIIHSHFSKFPHYLHKGDILVLNTSKVIPARVWGKKGNQTIEFLFLKQRSQNTWEVLCRPAKDAKEGDVITFSPRFKGRVIRQEKEGKRLLRFSSKEVLSFLKKIGFPPLPPYIKRPHYSEELRSLDLKRYQTVYAQEEGSIAAPTAGLHFSPQILGQLQTKGIEIIPLSLDVGLATFQPVRTERVEDHQMGEETYTLTKESAQSIQKAKKENLPVVAVGTTSVRALESSFNGKNLQPGTHSTDLFIYPGYRFKVVERLLTNFHLPKSTLLMLVSAFAGVDLIKKAYREAVEHKYRFYSYGDCMLIL